MLLKHLCKATRIKDEGFTQQGQKSQSDPASLHFPPYLLHGFQPILLYAWTREGLNLNVSNDFNIMHPRIRLPLNKLLNALKMTTSVPQDIVMWHILFFLCRLWLKIQ